RDHLADQASSIRRSLLFQIGLGPSVWLARRALLDRSLRFHGGVFLPGSDHATTAGFYRRGKSASSRRGGPAERGLMSVWTKDASPPISLDSSRSVESNQHLDALNANEPRAVEASRGILVES